jgi:hypothetical protein
MTNSVDEGDFQPIDPNPYVVGNPVRDPAMFFGREADFELIRSRFLHAHGGLIVLCGERRSGKTSILFQVLAGRLGPDFIPILIDMQSMAVENEAAFLARISSEILESLGETGTDFPVPDYTQEARPANVFYSFIGRFVRAHPGKKPVLLIDEYELFEPKIDSGVLSEDVLDILASLVERYSFFLVFTGSQHLEGRRRDYWRILPKSIYRRISYLQREDALKLIQQPVEGQVTYEEGTIEAIYHLTGGHPFYTQVICQTLVDTLNEVRSRRATTEILATVIERVVANPPAQMIFQWSSMPPDEKLTLTLLAEMIKGPRDTKTPRQVNQYMKAQRYPLDLTVPRIAAAMGVLFDSELLSKSAAETESYGVRLDLWRQWVARMHSVGQVMRESGLVRGQEGAKGRFRPFLRPKRVVAAAAIGLMVLLSALAANRVLRGSSRSSELRWKQLRPAGTLPPGLNTHTAIYDPLWNRMIVFGGGRDSIRDVGNEVWALSFNEKPKWTRLNPSGDAPSPRNSHAAVHDPTRDMMYVIGGYDGANTLNDVWALKLDTAPRWRQIHTTGDLPLGRSSLGVVLDPGRDRILVFGGYSLEKGPLNDLWELSLAGEHRWRELFPAGVGPSPRTDFGMSYDPVGNRIVLFGGIVLTVKGDTLTKGVRNDAWALSLADLTWSQLEPTGMPPSPRKDLSMIYDPVGKRMILFGGYDENGGRLGDLWELSTEWRQLLPRSKASPTERNDHSAVYDRLGHRMIVFGGSDLGHFSLNDLWSLQLSGQKPK